MMAERAVWSDVPNHRFSPFPSCIVMLCISSKNATALPMVSFRVKRIPPLMGISMSWRQVAATSKSMRKTWAMDFTTSMSVSRSTMWWSPFSSLRNWMRARMREIISSFLSRFSARNTSTGGPSREGVIFLRSKGVVGSLSTTRRHRGCVMRADSKFIWIMRSTFFASASNFIHPGISFDLPREVYVAFGLGGAEEYTTNAMSAPSGKCW
mmetsp:Transcript_24585/g.53647  ORF Transcript_24585/g.53647 Transcript_24585/m.53647 type:complete len:210 (-) Transcript_24585:101-730(-)